jgi:hypothetical protein
MRPSRRERLCKNVDCGYSGHEARPFGRRITAGPPCPCPVRLVTKAAWPRQASSRVHCNRPGAASYPNIIQSLADRLVLSSLGDPLWFVALASDWCVAQCTGQLQLSLLSPTTALLTVRNFADLARSAKLGRVHAQLRGQHGDGRHAGKRPGGTVAKREEEGPNRGEAAAAQQAHGEFLNDAQIAKEKWPSLLGRGGGLGD